MKDWVTLLYFQLKGTSWKIDLDDFVDEFDSRHDNRRIKLHWGDDDINSSVGSARICMRIVWICLGVELVPSTQGWKVSYWVSEENSVWILKWTTLLGIFCKIRFTPVVTSCYQVHVLSADELLYMPLVPKRRCCWLHTALNNPHPIHVADGHYTRNSRFITLLLVHHNHKMPISYHNNGLVSSHQSIGRWLIFTCFAAEPSPESFRYGGYAVLRGGLFVCTGGLTL